MGLSLRPGLSFCFLEGRAIFLDIVRDSYFCLKPQAEAAFARLAGGCGDALDHQALAGLIEDGLLIVRDDDAVPEPCLLTARPLYSLLETILPKPSTLDLFAAVSSYTSAMVRLRLRGLAPSMRAVQTDRERAGERAAKQRSLERTAAAFQTLTLLVSPLDRCLPLSLAMVRRLTELGLQAELLIGVQLRPFRAHSWVQHGDWVANDHLDTVRNFTPILVI